MIAAIHVAVEGIEVKRDDVTAAAGHVENGGAAQKIFFAPRLAADDKGSAGGVAPFEDNAGAIFGAIETGGAVGHTQPRAGSVVERKVLAEDVGVRRVTVGDGVIRAHEGDAHVRAGSARDGILRRSSGSRASARGAARDAAGDGTHATHEAAIESEHRAAAQGYEQAAAVHEALNFREAGVADAAGNVVGLGGRAEAGSLRRFLEGHGAPAFGQAFNLFGEFEIDVAIEKHVKLVAKFTGANVFVAYIGIRDFALIEDVADPSDGVRVRPGDPKANARNGGCMMRNGGSR